jgi:AcrR family transcriptional regulator
MRTSTLVNVKAVTRERNPRGQGERLRADLLRAAVALIAETGSIDGLTLRGAAKRAGVSPMAVYNHFADKDALVAATVQHCWTKFQTAVGDAAVDEDPSTRLRQMGEAYVRFATEQPAEYAVLFSGAPVLPDQVVGIGMSAFDDLVAVVRDVLAANGEDRDPTFVAVQVHTWVHGIVTLAACAPQEHWPGTEPLLDEVMTRLGLTPAG